MSRISDLQDFYSLLSSLAAKLDGPRTLASCFGRMNWPRQGVYFFMEDGENRSDSGSGLRIVRVGTHALTETSKTTLWTRLSQHRGQKKSGGGNHRGSIFRLIVGTALMARDGIEAPTWGMGNNAPAEIRKGENTLESKVSETLGKMPFLWLTVGDTPDLANQRGYIERNTIALLSNFDKDFVDSPSRGWLGHFCNRDRVRRSGLWNSNHVDENYDPAFLKRLERLIREEASA